MSAKSESRPEWYKGLALLAIIVVASLTIGFKTYFLVQFPIIIMAATLGLWLYYVQHQFADVYWVREDAWDRIEAALRG